VNPEALKSKTTPQSSFGAVPQPSLLGVDYSTFDLAIGNKGIIFIPPQMSRWLGH